MSTITYPTPAQAEALMQARTDVVDDLHALIHTINTTPASKLWPALLAAQQASKTIGSDPNYPSRFSLHLTGIKDGLDEIAFSQQEQQEHMEDEAGTELEVKPEPEARFMDRVARRLCEEGVDADVWSVGAPQLAAYLHVPRGKVSLTFRTTGGYWGVDAYQTNTGKETGWGLTSYILKSQTRDVDTVIAFVQAMVANYQREIAQRGGWASE